MKQTRQLLHVLEHEDHPLRAPIVLTTTEAVIIRILRLKGNVSRNEISNITGWSKAKTSQEINSLLAKGYLVEEGEGISQGGRKPHILCINDALGFLVGIDIGATSIDLALTNVTGKVLQRRTETSDVRQSPESVLGRCSEIVREMVLTQGCRIDQILGIGVGVPGPVDFSRGVLVAPPLMPEWENFDIRSFFTSTFTSAFVVVDNDVNIMALGEQRTGGGISSDNFLFVKIGTGIGAGILSNGKIHRGAIGCAGDIGHICIDKQGPLCRCGNTGCLEAMAAGPAITQKAVRAAQSGASPFLARMMEANKGVLRPEDVNMACRDGDKASLEIIRESGQMIGEVLASLVNFFNPSQIIIGGGITNFGNHFLVAIRRAVLRRSLPLATTNLTINFSRAGGDAGIIGALTLAMDYLFLIDFDPHLAIVGSNPIVR